MDIIINVEDQSWQAEANRSATDKELENFENNNLLANWIRVYKPVNASNFVNTEISNNSTRALTSNEEEKQELAVFPIPAKDVVNISSKDYVQAKVYNLQGLIVLRKDVADGKINVSSLEKGIYVLELAKANGESTKQKIVISK